jgi:hypothetical protein
MLILSSNKCHQITNSSSNMVFSPVKVIFIIILLIHQYVGGPPPYQQPMAPIIPQIVQCDHGNH